MMYNWVIEVEPGAFNGLTALTQFRFCYNRLGRLFRDMFSDLVSCTQLDLYANEISYIESGSFNGLSHVNSLQLHNNRLTTLKADTFQGLVDVTTIALNSNRINSIQDNSFVNLKKIWTLSLMRNEVEVLSPRTFAGLESLKTLHLYGNRLTMLRADVFSHLPRPLQVTLGEPEYRQPKDIPLKCDAELCWLKQEEQQGTIRTASYKPRCADGTLWNSWDCDETSKCHYLLSIF